MKDLIDMCERGFDRIDRRFDMLSTEIHKQGTVVAGIVTGCADHKVEDDKRDRRISSLTRSLGDQKETSITHITEGRVRWQTVVVLASSVIGGVGLLAAVMRLLGLV